MRTSKRSKRPSGKHKRYRRVGAHFLLTTFLMLISASVRADVTEQDIVDAILGRGTYTEAQLLLMDLNKDGKVDVADRVFLNQPVASFALTESTIDETTGTHNVFVTFTSPLNGKALHYTVGGTASTEDNDYLSPSGSVIVNGTTASIAVQVTPDTKYEGDETIELNLLPGLDYLLGENRIHTVVVKDNPNETAAGYLFNLSSKTLGVSGSTKDGKGFPPTLFSRTVSVVIAFSQNDILSAFVNEAESIGIADSDPLKNTIEAKTVSYSSDTLEIVFEYPSQSRSLVSSPSLTDFDPDKPDLSFGSEEQKALTNILTLTIRNFDLAHEKFSTEKVLEGDFSFSISGVFREATSSFFEGSLLGTMQP